MREDENLDWHRGVKTIMVSSKKMSVNAQNIPEEKAERVLEFLNTVRTGAEIASTIEIPGERDIGIRLAQKILDRRRELGRFRSLTEVAEIPQIGLKRFDRIVAVLGNSSFTDGHFHVTLDGKSAGFIKTLSGGNIRGEVAVHQLGAIQRKHLSTISYEPITVEVGMGMSKGFYEWISSSFDGGYLTKNGEIHACDFDFVSRSIREFSDAHISEITIPALDGSSKEPAYMTVKFEPEKITYKPGDGSKIKRPESSSQKLWLCSNFRFSLGGLPCNRVVKVESFTWSQKIVKDQVGASRLPTKIPAKIEVPNIKVTVLMADIEPWMDWHKSFLIDGRCAKSDELSGVLTFLGPYSNEPLAEIELSHVGLVSLSMEEPEGTKEKMASFTVELYVDEMKFDYIIGEV